MASPTKPGDRHVQAHTRFRPDRHHRRRRHAGRHRPALGRPQPSSPPRNRHRHRRRRRRVRPWQPARPEPRPVYVEDYGDSRHVRRCLARYASYDPYSDTYVGYDGYRHYCRL
ncbi:BA14K family protein [Mesorhizobium waimense]|uniref:BA14K family protein n=1 Tax=Mesorhizobium waimense TaxID=1300307 RepID=UPI001FE0C9DF|nr:BA14K family protein [Mesorhizobium waimense]